MDLPRADLDEPPTLPLLSMERHTNTAQLTKLGHHLAGPMLPLKSDTGPLTY